jgi:hypothetical protein
MNHSGQIVGFWETTEIVNLMDDVSRRCGTNRSSFIRETVRRRLAELSFLTDDDKKSLGVDSSGNASQPATVEPSSMPIPSEGGEKG